MSFITRVLSTVALLLAALSLAASPANAGQLLVDFNTVGGNLQAGFTAQGAANTDYSLEGGNVNVNTVGTGTTNRAFNSVASSGSSIVADSTEIGNLAMDHATSTSIGAFIDITVTPGAFPVTQYTFEGWFSDVNQGSGTVNQSLLFSTDGGTNFTTIVAVVDAATLNASPESFSFSLVAGAQDAVIRVMENNVFNQVRVSGFALSATAVPEPSSLLMLGVGLVGLASRRRRGK